MWARIRDVSQTIFAILVIGALTIAVPILAGIFVLAIVLGVIYYGIKDSMDTHEEKEE